MSLQETINVIVGAVLIFVLGWGLVNLIDIVEMVIEFFQGRKK